MITSKARLMGSGFGSKSLQPRTRKSCRPDVLKAINICLLIRRVSFHAGNSEEDSIATAFWGLLHRYRVGAGSP